MITKTIEIRDRMTFIPAIAVKLEPACERDRYLLARAGYGVHHSDQARHVLLTALGGGRCTYDPHDWGDRTMSAAHMWVHDHFDEIESGAVVDVEYILGERGEPAVSEQVESADGG